jgi:SAM-dependent methyltransferase
MSEMTSKEDASHRASAGPSPWILRFAGLVPAGRRVADIACGGGRHGRLFLAQGHSVQFVDRDVTGVADLAGRPDAEIVQADLEQGRWPLAGPDYAGVVVSNYLWRPILPRIVDLVGPGGLLIYETFALGNEAFGRPSNPDFLLRPGELLEAVRGRLDVLAYEQRVTGAPRPAVIQHIAARRG